MTKTMTSKKRSNSWKIKHGCTPLWGKRKSDKKNGGLRHRKWPNVWTKMKTLEAETEWRSKKKATMWPEVHLLCLEGARKILLKLIGKVPIFCSRTKKPIDLVFKKAEISQIVALRHRIFPGRLTKWRKRAGYLIKSRMKTMQMKSKQPTRKRNIKNSIETSRM